MAGGQISLKRIGVDKANSRIVTVTAVSSFLVVFFLVASYMLFSQMMYQNRVITVKKNAVKQLNDDVKARDSLVVSYDAFESAPQNLIGGNPAGSGANDGSNAKIILDALPSTYDFPALTASLEKLLLSQGVKINDISGTDDEVTQSQDTSTGAPKEVAIPFEFTVSGSYDSLQGVIGVLERSIRPFQIATTEMKADQDALKLTVTGNTYYQPANGLKIITKVVPAKGPLK
jgi:hypothetical protein